MQQQPKDAKQAQQQAKDAKPAQASAKDAKATPKQEPAKPAEPARPMKFEAAGGVVVEELKIGSGKVATKGAHKNGLDMITFPLSCLVCLGSRPEMYYRGWLQNNKQFDANLSGVPVLAT